MLEQVKYSTRFMLIKKSENYYPSVKGILVIFFMSKINDKKKHNVCIFKHIIFIP